jgi:DNA-binding response OmpR family regulator
MQSNQLMQTDMSLSCVEVGILRIDRVRFEVKIREHEVRLSRKEFELLWVLAAEDGRAFRREELIERVWGSGFYIDSRTVDVHIARLRTKLKDGNGAVPAIETVWGIGYRLRPPAAL